MDRLQSYSLVLNVSEPSYIGSVCEGVWLIYVCEHCIGGGRWSNQVGLIDRQENISMLW